MTPTSVQELAPSQQDCSSEGKPLLKLSTEQRGRAREHAMAAADALLLTDAPLLFTPAQLALAALRSGLKQVLYD